MYIYNVTCRIPEIVGGLIFRNVISSEEIHNFIVRRNRPIDNDSDLLEIKKLAQEKFGGKRTVESDWADFEYEPQVEILNIGFLGS